MRPRWAHTLFHLVCLACGCGSSPSFKTPEQLVFLDQGPHWNTTERAIYYYTPQGTELNGLRYDWMLALEEPTGHELLARPEHLARLGFLYDPEQLSATYQAPAYNPGNLPVGFTHHRDEISGDAMLDITCAACHTGQLEYNGTALRVDGGQAMHAFAWTKQGQFLTELLESLSATYINPFAFDRFAKRVLGTRYPEGKPELREKLRTSLTMFLTQAKNALVPKRLFADDGYGRIDALGHIANTVFGDDLDHRNQTLANAPVSYPHLWDIWKFDWVQWNASVAQPMGRNVGEALGVKARLEMVDAHGDALPLARRYASSVLIREQDCIETTLWKLGPPRWNENVLPPIDRRRLSRGKALFEQKCRGCHGPHVYTDAHIPPLLSPAKYTCATHTNEAKPTPKKPVEWKMCVIPANDIGTDSQMLKNFLGYRYDAGALDPANPALRSIDAGEALNVVTKAVIARKYKELNIDPWLQWQMDGWGRPTEVRTMDGYKARPLHGIWATPPFLHNGSVRSLYELLMPADEREKSFWVGSRQFDPRVVGYRNEKVPGAYLLDTSTIGNRNTGHQFSDGGPGTLGERLNHENRLDLIEYIKVLGNPAFAHLDTSDDALQDDPSDSTIPSTHLTAEPWVDAGAARCGRDLQGAPSVLPNGGL